MREGTVSIGRRRRLGFAEFGDPGGPLVLWFHGTPGARRQVPPAGRLAAARLGLRVVCLERPGIGSSSDHRHHNMTGFAGDALRAATELGHDQLAIVGLSGGGPYVLAAAAQAPERVRAVAVLGGVCPTVGPDAWDGSGVLHLAARFQRLLEPLRVPLGVGLWALLQPLIPFGHLVYKAFAGAMPAGDQAVFADPEIEAMFIDDLVHASTWRFGALWHDVALFGRDWGFRLGDVRVPVLWWHGNADSLVPLAMAEDAAAKLPDCTLVVRPGESHLGGFAAADEVLATLAAHLRG